MKNTVGLLAHQQKKRLIFESEMDLKKSKSVDKQVFHSVVLVVAQVETEPLHQRPQESRAVQENIFVLVVV